MIHYKLHTMDGTAWCGKYILAATVSGESTEERGVDNASIVTCPKCNSEIQRFAKQVGEEQKSRKDPNYFPCRK